MKGEREDRDIGADGRGQKGKLGYRKRQREG